MEKVYVVKKETTWDCDTCCDLELYASKEKAEERVKAIVNEAMADFLDRYESEEDDEGFANYEYDNPDDYKTGWGIWRSEAAMEDSLFVSIEEKEIIF